MMNRVQLLAAVLVVGWASPLCGATITSNTIISAENSFPGEVVIIVDGESPPTVVQMIDGGEAQRMHLSGASILNIQGGRVAESISATGTSSVNIRGGQIGSLTVSRGSSSANVFGGAIERDISVSSVLGITTLNVFGGEMGEIIGQGGSIPFAINIHGGHMDRIRADSATPTSVLNITGGSFDGLSLRRQMTVDWSGGDPRAGYLTLWDDSTLNVYGRNLVLREDFSSAWLSGVLLDGTLLDNTIVDRVTNAQVILHNVPEPASIGLAVMMIVPLLIRRGADRLRPFLAPRLLALVLLAGFAAPVGAVTIDYNTIISAENSFLGENVRIVDGESPPTVVQMIDGSEAQSITLTGASILNLHGGHVAERVTVTGTSIFNIRGGDMGRLDFNRGSATANVFGGTINGDVNLSSGLGSPTLNVFGGSLSDVVAQTNNHEPFTLNIHGGYMEWVRIASYADSSVVNITGGSFDRFSPRGRMTVDWSGGEPRAGYLTLWDDSTLNIYGRDLVHRVYEFGGGHLSGTLLDGTVLDNIYIDRVTNAQVILHNVPEPATFELAVVGVAVVVVCWSAHRRGGAFGAIGDGVASYQ